MLRALAGIVLVVGGAIGVLHLPAARRVLSHLGIRWGCPVQVATPAQVEASFAKANLAHRGSTTTSVRPAAGFELGVTTQAMADAKLPGCTREQKGFSFVRCANVPASAIDEDGAPIELVTLAFDRTDRLVSVDVWRSHLSTEDAAAIYEQRARSLQSILGAPMDQHGDSEKLETALAQASREYRFSNYLAKLTATNLPGKGVAVRELFTDVKSR